MVIQLRDELIVPPSKAILRGNLSPWIAFHELTNALERKRWIMNGIIYLVGIVVVIGIVLSFLGLR
jgi:hypothetical protein